MAPELDGERRMADAEFDRAFASVVAAKGEADRARKREALDAVRRRQEAVRDKIRAVAPRDRASAMVARE